MARVQDGKVVDIEYTLRLSDGEIADATEGTPLAYLHGAGEIVAGLERALAGKTVGDAFDVVVEAADGFGEEDPDLFKDVDLAALDEDKDLEEGDEVTIMTDEGEEVTAIVEAIVDDKTVRLDFNHPLAGEALHFQGKIVSIRDATDEEKQAGEALTSITHH